MRTIVRIGNVEIDPPSTSVTLHPPVITHRLDGCRETPAPVGWGRGACNASQQAGGLVGDARPGFGGRAREAVLRCSHRAAGFVERVARCCAPQLFGADEWGCWPGLKRFA